MTKDEMRTALVNCQPLLPTGNPGWTYGDLLNLHAASTELIRESAEARADIECPLLFMYSDNNAT